MDDRLSIQHEGDESMMVDDGDVRRNLLPDLATPARPSVAPVSDHMEVYLRVRPLSEVEENKKENQGCVEVESQYCLMTHAPKDSHTYKNHLYGLGKQKNKFTFSRIFPENTTQKEFFDHTVLSKVKDFIDGQNCLIFTYGVTNSGKTYTVQGSTNDAGILPRSLDVIFNSIGGQLCSDMQLKPRMFQDVGRLNAEQEEAEKKLKESIMKMAVSVCVEDSIMVSDNNVTHSDIDTSHATVNSTMSEDSLLSRHSMASNRSVGGQELHHILSEAETRIKEDAAVNVENQGPIKFSVWVSYVEIYNEQMYDLLDPPPKKKKVPTATLR